MTQYHFFNDPDAELYFAELDYRLRAGQHIQAQFPGQEDVFRFLSKYKDEVRIYYEKLFGLLVEEAGSAYGNRYYYLNSVEDLRNKVPTDSRRFLKKESLLIGIFLCKLEIDFSEVQTISGFKKALREDYEAYKDNFFRLRAHASGDGFVDTDEETVDKKIESAFNDFYRLGWVYLEGDRFEIMPSLERLRMLYLNEINNIGELSKHE